MTTTHKHRLVVVGDAILDCNMLGRADRLSPDAPVPVVDVDEVLQSPGGAGLTALMCLADDMEVTLVAPVADDAHGARLSELLRGCGVQVVALPHAGETRRKTRVRCDGQSLLRLDEGGPGTPHGPLPEEVTQALEAADVVLVSDYGGGTTAHPQLRELLAVLAEHRPMCWDPHPRGEPPVASCALVTPNLREARAALADDEGSPDRLAGGLVRRWRARAVAVTTGASGAWLSTSADEPYFVAAQPVAAGDPCGAGDRFCATAAQGLARGLVVTEATASGVSDASAWVGDGGLATLRAGSLWSPPSARRRASPCAAVELVGRVRRKGGTVVATGGCFDVLHAGHISSLEASAALGDILVVLLNSDASVGRLKGPNRPVQPAEDRARVLLGLSSVDAVLVFEEDDPCAVLDRLRPDIWTKGGDYDANGLPELALVRSWGGRVVLLPYLAGRSTTAILTTTT